MTECRLAFSLCTPSMYTYTHIFIYPTVTAVPRPPPPPPFSGTCSLRIFQFVCSSKLLFCAFCQMNFPRRSLELFGICLQLCFPYFVDLYALPPISHLYIYRYICLYNIFMWQSSKILISSPTNFVIACCVCREEKML